MISKFLNGIKQMIVNKYLGSAVRKLLSVLVGILIASNIPGAAELGQVLTENLPVLESSLSLALGYLFLQGWSWVQKYKSDPKKKLSKEVTISLDEYNQLLSTNNSKVVKHVRSNKKR